MAGEHVGGQLTPQQQQYLGAAADLAPDKSLNRADDLAKFVFANAAVVGTILTGLGLFSGASLTLRRGPSVLGVPLTIAFVALSLLAAIGALFPTLTAVNPGDLDSIERFFKREIRRRGLLSIASLVLFAIAIVSAGVVAVTGAATNQTAPAISVQLTGTGQTAMLDVSSQANGQPQGSLLTVTATGHRKRSSHVLCDTVALIDASGAATVSCHTAAETFSQYRVTALVTHDGRTLQRNTLSVGR